MRTALFPERSNLHTEEGQAKKHPVWTIQHPNLCFCVAAEGITILLSSTQDFGVSWEAPAKSEGCFRQAQASGGGERRKVSTSAADFHTKTKSLEWQKMSAARGHLGEAAGSIVKILIRVWFPLFLSGTHVQLVAQLHLALPRDLGPAEKILPCFCKH